MVALYMIENWIKEQKSISSFQLNIRAAIRGLWAGHSSIFDFVDNMQNTITRGFAQAFIEGAAVCGIRPDELLPQEIAKRDELILAQMQFVMAFGLEIEASSKANGGLLGPLLQRGVMWVNRYNETKGIAQSMVCSDIKTIWILGNTDHCRSCLGFSGRIYRESVWSANNAQTQGNNLCCHGFRCQCQRVPTNQPITPGRFPVSLLCG